MSAKRGKPQRHCHPTRPERKSSSKSQPEQKNALSFDFIALRDYLRNPQASQHSKSPGFRSSDDLDDTLHLPPSHSDFYYRWLFYRPTKAVYKFSSLQSFAASNFKLQSLIEKKTFWMDVMNPTRRELLVLAKMFGIRSITVEEILRDNGQEKTEDFGSYVYTCFRSKDAQHNSLRVTVRLHSILLENGLLTFHSQPVIHQFNLPKRLRKIRPGHFCSPEWIHYIIHSEFLLPIHQSSSELELEADLVQDMILEANSSDLRLIPRRIGVLHKRVLSLKQSLMYKLFPLKKLVKKLNRNKSPVAIFYHDLENLLSSTLLKLKHLELSISRVNASYLAFLCLQCKLSAASSNILVSRFTVSVMIFYPITIINSIWNLDVICPGEATDPKPFKYIWLTALTSVYALILVISFFFCRKYHLI